MTIDRALSGNPFRVDQFRCLEAARLLRTFNPKRIRESWSGLPLKEQLVFKILFISICQQFNWDFLQDAMARWLLPRPRSRLPELTSVRPSDIASLLNTYNKPERIRSTERARMLRETSASLQELLDLSQFKKLLRVPHLEGAGGFYELMKRIPAYAEDELEKKLRVLAHDLHRERILSFSDPENLRPAVEYHLLRLYLRSGRVYPTDPDVRAQLTGPATVPRARLVKLLRRAVEEAMNLTAFYAKMDVATLNYVEWQIGRSVCTPDLPPFCARPPAERLPDDVAALSLTRCAYAGFCRSFTDSKYGWYSEPRFQKAIY